MRASVQAKLALTATVVAALSSSVHAQWSGYSGPATIMMQQSTQNMFGLTRLGTMQRAFALDQRRRKSTQATTPHPQTSGVPAARSVSAAGASVAPASWRIDSDPAVTRQVHDRIIGDIARSQGQTAANQADRIYGNIQTTFGKMVAPYRLRNDDLIDVMTAYMVVMWMSVNQRTVLPTTPQVLGVRQQMQSVFSSAQIGSTQRAQRQVLAETAMYLTCLAVSMREQAVAQSRQDLLKSLSEQIEHSTSGQGLNLRQLALTDEGFSPL